MDRESEFITLDFRLANGTSLPIATTRPELLPACVATRARHVDIRLNDPLHPGLDVVLNGDVVGVAIEKSC